MSEVKFELFKPYELKVAFQRMPMSLQNRAAFKGWGFHKSLKKFSFSSFLKNVSNPPAYFSKDFK